MSPEGELIWSVIHPDRDTWDFPPADSLLGFTRDNGLFVTASHFVWDQATEVTGTPDWVLAIDDPVELEAVMREHLSTVHARYGAAIGRWNVVNEPLDYFASQDLYDNHFYRVLGPDYIAKTFQIAREEAPGAELWLNEIFTESYPDKCAALVALAKDLVDRKVPIDGVSLQGHLFPREPDFALVHDTLQALAALGLKVAVSELDAPVDPDVPHRLDVQAQRMAGMVEACRAVPACDSVTVWGLHDGVSWLNWLLDPGLAPLLFDEHLERKPSYYAVRDVLAAGRP